MVLKKSLVFLLSLLIFSCDDGDIIVTEFDFENENLQLCETGQNLVFFKITNDTNESISLQLNEEISFLETNGLIEVALGGSNIVNYRKFNAAIQSNYFCSSIPPSSPNTILEYIAENGQAKITNTVILDDNDGIMELDETPNEPPPNGDEDEDSIPNYLDVTMENDTNEDGIVDAYDTDMDGIPNFYDFDDDGDNVPTINELGNMTNSDGTIIPKDTDEDGIPDYLDEDDDGDGILTRNESTDGDLSPLNDEDEDEDGILNYLDDDTTASFTNDVYIQHEYNIKSDVEILLLNLTLVNENEKIVQGSLNLGTIIDAINKPRTQTPDFE